ncbi:MAG: glycoside hydrolase family 97 N-terminal domain-containing protein [Pseudomonadota bacterium]
MLSLNIRWVGEGRMMGGMHASTSGAVADEVLASIASPGRVLTVTVRRALDGRLAYAVQRHCQTLIAPSRLGIVLRDAAPLDAGLSLARQAAGEHRGTVAKPGGARRSVRYAYRQLRLDLLQPAQAGRRLAIVFRVFDDGLGFRYEFAGQAVGIAAELSEFVVAPPADAWWQPAAPLGACPPSVRKSRLADVDLASLPLTVRTGDGIRIAFDEVAPAGHPAMCLRKIVGQKLRVQLAGAACGEFAGHAGAFTTPWRTLHIVDGGARSYFPEIMRQLGDGDGGAPEELSASQATGADSTMPR